MKHRQEHEKAEFDIHEVYAIDVLVSSGDGKPREMDARTTIYKRNPEILYQLKMKASRGNAFYNFFCCILLLKGSMT